MKIYAIDDEILMIRMLEESIREALPGEEPKTFTRPSELLAAAKEDCPDVVFLDVEMPGMTGLELAEKLKNISPTVNLIFVTGFSQYSLEAFRLFASGYLMKPVDADAIRDAMKNLRYEIREKKPVTVKTFGNFAVFSDGIPVKFRLAKSKEMLAYLVDREGVRVSKAEIAGALFGDDYSRSVQAELTRAARWLEEDLKAAGAEAIFLRDNGKYFVNPQEFDCDLYDFLAKKGNVTYAGEYMEQYDWPEFRKSAFGEIAGI